MPPKGKGKEYERQHQRLFIRVCDHVCVHRHAQSAHLQVLDPPTPTKSKIGFVGGWIDGDCGSSDQIH